MLDEIADYDVVTDTLQKHIDILDGMIKANEKCGMFNIMDQIRLKQIDELQAARDAHKKKQGE